MTVRLRRRNDRVPPRPRRTADIATVKRYLRAVWHQHWWELAECDRCQIRLGSGNDYPCDTCGRWPGLVEDFRKGRLTRMVPL